MASRRSSDGWHGLVRIPIGRASLLAQDYISDSSYVLAGSGTQSTRTINPLYRSVRATLEMKF